MASSATTRIEEYLAKLPGGVHAFPDTRVKYSVVGLWMDGHDREPLAEALPPEVRPLLEPGFPVSRWVTEVHATCIYLALRELFFPSDDAFVADALERNRALLQKPMYKVLLRLFSPERAAKGTAVAFSQMHRGVTLEVEALADAWIVRLRHPPNIVPELLGRCYATAVRGALEVKGYAGVTAEPIAFEEELTAIRVLLAGD